MTTSDRLLIAHMCTVTHGDELHGGHRLRRKSRHASKLLLHKLALLCGASVAVWAAAVP